MMRVALVDPSLFTLPYDTALTRGLAGIGHAVTLHGRRAGPEDGALRGVNVVADFYCVTESAPIRALPGPVKLGIKGVDHAWSMTRLLRRLWREKPDVIHFQWLPLPLIDGALLPAFRRVAPLVLTVHDTDPFNGDPTSRLQQHGFARCLERFDRLIVHTEQGKTRLRQLGVSSDLVAVLPHGLLGDIGAAERDTMSGPLTFILFGKLKPYKGADLLIEAFARVPAALRAEASVRIVGKPYMDVVPLQALAETRGVAHQVHIEPRFVGDEEIAGLFGNGTVAMFPYREIEASGVLSFALAHGRPVVASDIGGFREALVDGVHGRLVPAGDVGALAAALVHILSDPDFAASCARNVRDRAGRVPGWREIARRTVAVYEAAGARDGQPDSALSSDHGEAGERRIPLTLKRRLSHIAAAPFRG